MPKLFLYSYMTNKLFILVCSSVYMCVCVCVCVYVLILATRHTDALFQLVCKRLYASVIHTIKQEL